MPFFLSWCHSFVKRLEVMTHQVFARWPTKRRRAALGGRLFLIRHLLRGSVRLLLKIGHTRISAVDVPESAEHDPIVGIVS